MATFTLNYTGTLSIPGVDFVLKKWIIVALWRQRERGPLGKAVTSLLVMDILYYDCWPHCSH